MSSTEPEARTGAPTWVPWVLGAAGLIGTAIASFLWIQERQVTPAEVTSFLSEHHEDATDISTEILNSIVTYSPDTVEDQAREVRDLATGQFLADYEKLLAEGLGEIVAEAAATSEGEIATGPDIAFLSAQRATAVARVVQEISTIGDEPNRTVFSVMRLGLVFEDGRWKADRLEILSQNSV